MDNLTQNGPIDPHLVKAARAVPHQVGLVKLSKTQLRVLKSIDASEEVTASQIATRCDLSPSWASTLLRRLFEKCYLQRSSGVLHAGGIEFKYYR